MKLTLTLKLLLIAIPSFLGVLLLSNDSNRIPILATLSLTQLALYVVFHFHINSKTKDILESLENLKQGNFKSLSPIYGKDVFSRIQSEINSVAENTQKTLSTSQSQERSKQRWLQELAHDLRTPLATLEVLLLSMHENNETLSPTKREEIIEDSLQESLYLKNLVDDMLLLALLDDPSYFSRKERLNITEVLLSKIDQYKNKAEKTKKSLHFKIENDTPLYLSGNQKLLERLINNCLNNALYYSKLNIFISLTLNPERKQLSVVVSNDGAPFTDLQILNFGNDREAQKREGSLGLGSVIIRRTASIMGASLEVKNLKSTSLTPLPCIEIKFPIT